MAQFSAVWLCAEKTEQGADAFELGTSTFQAGASTASYAGEELREMRQLSTDVSNRKCICRVELKGRRPTRRSSARRSGAAKELAAPIDQVGCSAEPHASVSALLRFCVESTE